MRLCLATLLLAMILPATTMAGSDGGEDWPMYGRNLEHTFSNPASHINSANVAKLQRTWTFATGDAVTASLRSWMVRFMWVRGMDSSMRSMLAPEYCDGSSKWIVRTR